MRYVAFTALGLLFALAALVAGYNRLTPVQQQHFVCFTHIADEAICKEWGWVKL